MSATRHVYRRIFLSAVCLAGMAMVLAGCRGGMN